MRQGTRSKNLLFLIITIVLWLTIAITLVETSLHAFRYIKYLTSPKDEITFYVIGGSTSYGNPFFDQPSFSRLIKDALHGQYQGLKIKIAMLARGGKTLISNLYEIKKYLFLNPQRNAIILAYTGINEGVSNKYEKTFSLESILNKSITGSIIFRLYEQQRERSEFFEKINNSLFLYEKRLQNLIFWANYAGHHVYLSELVQNLHDTPPAVSCFSFHNIRPTPTQFRNLVTCETKPSSYQKIDCYKKFKQRNKKKIPVLDFVIAREQYRISPDTKYLKALNRYSYLNCPLYYKNKIIKRVANENKGVTFIPLLEKFKSFGDNLVGYNLFGDFCHPNLEGMIIIAEQFLSSLTEYDIKVGPLPQIKKRYRLDNAMRRREIIWHDLKVAFWSSLDSPFPFYFFYRAKNLITHYRLYHYQLANIIESIIHPILPIQKNIKSIKQEVQFLGESEFQKLNQLFDHPSVKNNYLSIIERARKSSLISEDLYQEYQALVELIQKQ